MTSTMRKSDPSANEHSSSWGGAGDVNSGALVAGGAKGEGGVEGGDGVGVTTVDVADQVVTSVVTAPPRKKSKDKNKRRKSSKAMLNLLHTHNLLGARSTVAMLGTAMPEMHMVPEQVRRARHILFVLLSLSFSLSLLLVAHAMFVFSLSLSPSLSLPPPPRCPSSITF
jgi:hypothetical protein